MNVKASRKTYILLFFVSLAAATVFLAPIWLLSLGGVALVIPLGLAALALYVAFFAFVTAITGPFLGEPISDAVSFTIWDVILSLIFHS